MFLYLHHATGMFYTVSRIERLYTNIISLIAQSSHYAISSLPNCSIKCSNNSRSHSASFFLEHFNLAFAVIVFNLGSIIPFFHSQCLFLSLFFQSIFTEMSPFPKFAWCLWHNENSHAVYGSERLHIKLSKLSMGFWSPICIQYTRSWANYVLLLTIQIIHNKTRQYLCIIMLNGHDLPWNAYGNWSPTVFL